MLEEINLSLILIAGLLASASPGPATLAIIGTSMAEGRKYGIALASGICTGSLTWSVTTALGLGAIMNTNVWALELIRYFGAAYLIFLGIKSAKAAFQNKTINGSDEPNPVKIKSHSLKHAYLKGLLIHLTNPKAALFFGSLFAVAIPPDTSAKAIAILILALLSISLTVFLGYAILFSSAPLARKYLQSRKWFEAAFAAAFITAGLKILTTRIE